MSSKKILNAAMAAYRQNLENFCRNNGAAVSGSVSPDTFRLMTEGLLSAGRDAGQTGLAAWLKEHDTRQSSVEVKGMTYRYKNTLPKTFLTMFGDVTVERAVYGNDVQGGYVIPLDRALGLKPDERTTLDVREIVLFALSGNTPEEVAGLLSKVSLCRPCRTTIQEIANRDGAYMEQDRERIEQSTLSGHEVPDEAKVLVTSMDAATVLLREPGVRKGRKGQRPRGPEKTEESSSSSFRNAVVGCVSWYGLDEDGAAQRINTVYQARMPQDGAPVFKENFERTIISRIAIAKKAGRNIEKVLLCDGDRSIWNYARQNPLFEDFHHCIDFYHTTEHLSKAAEAIFGAKSPRGQWWYNGWREALKTDANAPTGIIRSIISYLKRHKLPPTRRTEAHAELIFFKRNRRLMRYPEFVARGFPIGSGPVEAAAKVIVKQRMCRSGMRWTREKGQYILTLRALVKSRTWDAAWHAYEEIRKAA
jgi:hypothetical protein